jgi:hypothetical protein
MGEQLPFLGSGGSMNFVAFSPHFPFNFIPFTTRLRQAGINVLGLGDEPFNMLRDDLKAALTEYYYVSNQHNYDELVRAMGYYTHHYGKIDRIESHNEYWLETDARLRTDFNIPGLKTADMARVKQKSKMKAVFQQVDVAVARGQVCHELAEAQKLVDETGYPLIAKPDIGVGANKTYKITNPDELEAFFNAKPPVNYIFEEFIPGAIQTYDGLVDQDGKIVFSMSLEYNAGVMDLVNQGLDFWYFTQRRIPPDLEAAGRRLVEAYGLRERFFHFEFFRLADGSFVGLELNMRPPGGLTVDMWNFANDIDIFAEYASVVAHNRFNAVVTRPYYCAYIGRRSGRSYLLTHEQVLSAFPKQLVNSQPISGIFAAALGDYGYLARSPDLKELEEIAALVLKKA